MISVQIVKVLGENGAIFADWSERIGLMILKILEAIEKSGDFRNRQKIID